MKRSKKTITALTFTLGACVFISTAFADALLGSGYDQLKSAAKHTAAQMEKGLGNYTIEAMATLKDNDQTLFQVSSINKMDTATQASEETSRTQLSNREAMSHYSYSDKSRRVWKNGNDERYYVTEYAADVHMNNQFTSPFHEKGAPEVEKIVDAVVGNLKDYVQAEERPNGGKMYSGSLSEAQVPAVVNAVASFGMKQLLREQDQMGKNADLPDIESDIYVKKVTGTATESKAGILESVTGDVTLSGKDKSGTVHDLKLNVVFKLSDVGNTKITLPDLTGANVEKVTDTGGFSSKYVGKYKNDIVTEKNGKFVKIGERNLEITSVDKDKVTGKYHESVKPEFAAEYADLYNFSFEYNPTQKRSMSTFTYKNAKGEQENGQLHPNGNGKLYLELGIEILDNDSYKSNTREYYDREFVRVFEE